MGKTRKLKSKYFSELNPLSITLQESGSDLSGPVEAVRNQLQSANLEEKLNGLHALAVLATNKDKVTSMCKSDIVRIAGPLLCEKELTVRSAAAGALRNLSTNNAQVCEFLVGEDLLTPLLTLLAEYAHNAQWAPKFDESMCGQIDLKSDIFLHSINLLWNLCESSSIALDTFNQSQLLESFIRCLDYKIFGLDIAISVAQCLLVVSENNQKSWNILNQHVSLLKSILSITGEDAHILLSVLSAGILANVPAIAASNLVEILHTLNRTLEKDHVIESNCLPSNQESISKPELHIKMDTVEEETEQEAAIRRRRQELPTINDIAIRDFSYLLDAQRVATEVLTNLCSSEEEENEFSEDDIEDSESINECEMNSQGEKLPIELLETIKATGIISKIWQKAQPFPMQNVRLLRKIDERLLMKENNLRISSLLCLQNLCNSLNVDDMGGPEAIYNVWVELCQQALKEHTDPTLLEPLTSLMRSALECIKTNRELFNKITKNDLEMILAGINNSDVSSVAEFRANWLRMLGTLACLLNEEFVKIILPYIINSCMQEEDVWTISEGLDALMDVFADNDWNQVVADIKLKDSVKDLEKIFKTKIRQQKRELKERYLAVRTVQDNFSRFVKYLQKQG